VHPTARHEAAAASFRALVRDHDLTPPDRVEYAPESVVFLWDGPQLAVVIDLEPEYDSYQ
jgi:hypothetical protein